MHCNYASPPRDYRERGGVARDTTIMIINVRTYLFVLIPLVALRFSDHCQKSFALLISL
jgi:hypothetical protein